MDPSQKRVTRPKLDLDWASQREEFGDHLQAVTRAKLGAKGFSSGQTDSVPPEWAFRVDGTGLVSHLRLRPKGPKLCVFVVGPREMARAEIDLWDGIVREAFALMGLDRHEWPWAAIIAPALNNRNPGRGLAHKIAVGPLTLRPGSRAIKRRPRQVPWQVPPIAMGWPVVVEGTAWYRGPIWSDDQLAGMRQATRQLYRLCALLTVVLDGTPWNLELVPAPGPPGFIDVPDHLIDPDPLELSFNQDPIEIPDWLESSWSVIEEDGLLDRALSAYLEGAQLRTLGHPSVALVAFSACIESLSTSHSGDPCPKCGEARGSTDRFWGAIRNVLSPAELQ